MIDYHGLSAAVGVTISALHAAQEDPTLAPTAEEIAAAVDEEPEIARLGAMIAPLLALAGPAEAELDLVRRASGLWRRGVVAGSRAYLIVIHLKNTKLSASCTTSTFLRMPQASACWCSGMWPMSSR